MDGKIPFEPDRADVNPDPKIDSAEADALASGVDPEDLGFGEDRVVSPDDADRDPEATP